MVRSNMARARFIIGIDLGTTNCAVAFVDTKGRERPSADVRPFEIPQLVAPGETSPRPMLPSFVYLPGPHELPAGATRLPWSVDADRIVGEFARIQGAKVPNHLVSSAKSWLCHPGVDREAAILPWGTTGDVRKVSPVAASTDLLVQIRDAWDNRFAAADPAHRFIDQEIFLTVPASFDEAARELTVLAARNAGITHPVLLEEPQAAFYCWIVTHQDGWQRQVRGGELILVCDVGGGTTDFSLITVVETSTGPGFRRVAVGDHLMLGGDNVDLALAHLVEKKLGARKLDTEQWAALRLACRSAKEKLLADDPAERWPVTIAGRGSKLIGGSLQSELTRDEVSGVVLDGFFPLSGRDAEPERGQRVGLQEFGLPFVSDPAIPKHLASFLRRHRDEIKGATGPILRPDAILFNGGALTPKILRDRVVDVVRSWFADDPDYAPRTLSNTSLDLAVAHGAAYYGVVRRGGGIRIGGGTARSYYVGFETETAAHPWLCVVPRDSEEGTEITIDRHEIDLLMGQPVAFPLASSSVRPHDQPGDLVASDPDSILDLPPLVGLMRVGRKAKAERVPVRLASRVTEFGTVELWCQARNDDRRWRLQIQLRAAGATPPPNGPGFPITSADADAMVIEQSELDAAIEAIRTAFSNPTANDPDGPARLIKKLEEILDAPRDNWPPSALRALWEPLRAATESRLKSPRHESRWFNLAGFCLRPGTGYPLDEARIKPLWANFSAGVKHTKDIQVWADWWVLWRRVAAGLNRAHHDEIYRRLASLILPGKPGSTKKLPRPKPEAHELAEIWRCAASLERLPTQLKEQLGDTLIEELDAGGPIANHSLWCLGRIGARVPLYGPANTVVPADKAARWLARLIDRTFAPGRETADAIFALAQIARVSGDRARDLDATTRIEVIARMVDLGADELTIQPVREFHELQATQQAQALGDALPTGLRMLATAD